MTNIKEKKCNHHWIIPYEMPWMEYCVKCNEYRRLPKEFGEADASKSSITQLIKLKEKGNNCWYYDANQFKVLPFTFAQKLYSEIEMRDSVIRSMEALHRDDLKQIQSLKQQIERLKK